MERALQLTRHDSGAHRFEMATAAPAAALRLHVTRYCGYEEHSTAAVRRREVPSGEVTLIISLGPRIEVALAADPDAVQRSASFLASLSDSAGITGFEGHQHGVELNLTPLGAFRLFGLPMHELTNRVIDLDHLWGRDGDLLAERLHGTSGWLRRFELLDRFLAARLEAGPQPRSEVVWAWGRLRSSAGRARVSGLMRELGWSNRRLVGAFREQVGMAPKAVGGLLRFERASTALRDEPQTSLAGLAFDCGYYDQAHLNRDFRRFAGVTPTAYAANLMPSGGGVAL